MIRLNFLIVIKKTKNVTINVYFIQKTQFATPQKTTRKLMKKLDRFRIQDWLLTCDEHYMNFLIAEKHDFKNTILWFSLLQKLWKLIPQNLKFKIKSEFIISLSQLCRRKKLIHAQREILSLFFSCRNLIDRAAFCSNLTTKAYWEISDQISSHQQ